MADLEKTIKILFEGDSSGVQTAIRGFSGSVDAMAGKVQNVTGPVRDLAEKLLKIEAAMIGASAAFLAFAIRESGQFNSAFAEISTLIDTTSENLGLFRQDILEYAAGSTQSFGQTNAAVYSAISAGVDYQDSLKALATAEKLAVAGKADLESTLVALASTINAYGDSMDEASRYADVFFTTVKEGQTTIPELSGALSKVTSIASTLEVPIETLGAAIAALTAGGMETSQAVTGLTAAFANLIKPSAAAQELAAELGIDFSAAAVKTKGFENVLQEVADATGGNVDQMAQLFGSVQGLNSVLALTGGGAEKFASVLDEMEQSAGATEAAFEKMAENISLANQKLANNVKGVFIRVGSEIEKEYAGVVAGLAEVFKGVSIGLDEGAFQPVFDTVRKFLDTLSNSLSDIAKILPEAMQMVDTTELVNAFESLGATLQKLFENVIGEINLSTVEGLAQAIQDVVDIFTGLTKFAEGFLSKFEPITRLIGSAVDKLREADSDALEKAGGFAAYATMVDIAAGKIAGMTSFVADFAIAILALKAAGAAKAAIGVTALAGAVGKFSAVIAANPVVLAALTGAAIGTGARKLFPGIDEATQSMLKSIGAMIPWSEQAKWARREAELLAEAVENGVNPSLRRFKIAMEAATQPIEAAAQPLRTMQELVKELSELKPELEIYLDIEDTEENRQQLQDAIDVLRSEAEGYPVIAPIQARLDEISAREAEREMLDTWEKIGERADGTPIMMRVEADTAPLEELKEEVTKLTDDKKILVQLETEKIRAQAQTVEAALRFSAEVQMAGFEADAKRLVVLAESVGGAFASTGEVISSIVGIVGDFDKSTRSRDRLQIEQALKEEQKMRSEQHQMQKDIFELEKQRMEIQVERMASGEELVKIEIDSSGLEPALELIMWEIIEKVQLRASQSLAEFLLGVPS